jgi:hypothetical protein
MAPLAISDPELLMIIDSSVRARAVITAMLLLVGAAATAADTLPPEHPALSKETREKMATLHEQMAACLRSDRPLSECHSAMMKSCQEQLGSDGCPMIMGMGHGTDKRTHMQPLSDSAKPADK